MSSRESAESPLVEVTEQQRRSQAITWYRTPISSADMKALHKRSDLHGFIQTVGYLAILASAGIAAAYSAGHWPWWATAGLIFAYGMITNFMINGVHELGHGTVFKTKALNEFFVRILSFLGWINFEMFQSSHARHHRYTLHPPDDLEVVLPVHILVRHFLMQGFINPQGLWIALRDAVRVAFGRFRGEWEQKLFPADKPETQLPIRWARTMLAGHALVLGLSIYFKLWLPPVLITLGPFYGGWLFFLCNNTQHIGLQDNVSDFRLCCRTFTLNPVVRFIYWQMNYHTEHHMYAAVPCYNLGKLHRLIKHDLPPCPAGIVATWLEIAAIQKMQAVDPAYQHIPPLPNCPTA